MEQTDALSAPPKAPHEAVTPPRANDLTHDWPTLRVLQLRYLHRALDHMKNNKTRTAELLGIDRRTLNRILARERGRGAAAGTEKTSTV